MAQNLHQLPPTKRFKILNSELMSMSQPLRETDKHNRNSLPAKKHTEVLGTASSSSSTSSFLPAKKRVEIDLNTAPSISVCFPTKKRSENRNCSTTPSSLPAKKRSEIVTTVPNSSCLPAKKRTEMLNVPSTSSCLPAKKRVWAPHPLSPPKSDTQEHGAGSLVEERGKVPDGGETNGVPVKKRAWVRILTSPPEPVTQSPVADPICAIANGETKEANHLPAKKRVWISNPLTDAKVEVPDLNSVPERNQINDGKELKEIRGVSDPNPLSANIEDSVEKQTATPNLLSETKEGSASERMVSDPNPLSAIQQVTEKPVVAPNPISSIQEDSAKKPVPASNQLSAIHEKITKTPVSSANPLPRIKEDPVKKRVSDPDPLTPDSPRCQQKDPIKAKALKETHGIPAKKRVSDPNPLSTKLDFTAKQQIGLENPLASGVPGILKEVTNLKPVQEKDAIKDLKGLAQKKRVWAPNLLSLTTPQTGTRINNGEATDEVPSKKKVRYVHPLSPIAEEKDQTEHQTKVANETTTVLVKKRIWAPEPLASGKTQNELDCDPEPVKLRAENENQMVEGDEIHGDPLMQVFALHPLSPVKIETQNEEKALGSIEEEIDDGVLCAVCQSTDGEPSDPIVFCDGCDLMVHASCYGNPLVESIPEGDWFCSACSSKAPRKEKRCCLCPVKGGALKPTLDGKWAHVMCALLVPEVFFRDPEGRDGIDCSRVPHKRWQKDCFICGRITGCAIDCAESKCKLGFHVSCGLEEGLSIEYKEGKGGDIVAGFCTEHTKLWKKQQATGKFKIVSKE